MQQNALMQPGMVPFNPGMTAEMQQQAIAAAMTPQTAPQGPPASPSIFASPAAKADSAAGGGSSDWTSAAAKAVAALQDGEAEVAEELMQPADESGYTEVLDYSEFTEQP